MAKNKGSMTVEVSLTLMVFVSLLLMLIAFARLIVLYGNIQTALNQTAKELASYSYIYAASGLMQINDQLQHDIDQETLAVDQTAELVLDVFGGLRELESDFRTSDWPAVAEEVKRIYTDTTSLTENIRQLANDPAKLVTALIYLGYEESLYYLKSRIVGAMAQAVFPKYLPSSVEGVSDYLESYGIKDGFQGLDFTETVFLEDDESLQIVVRYQALQGLPVFQPLRFNIVQRAAARAWLTGDTGRNNPTQNPVTSVWNDKNYFRRGKTIIANESRQHPYRIINISGLHALNAAEGTVEIVRILSYDATKPTNDIEQFQLVISRHLAVMDKKIASAAQLMVECNASQERKLVAIGENLKVSQMLVVIVPENIEVLEWQEMQALIDSSVLYDKAIKLKKGYGSSQTEGQNDNK